jgi:hypothetical protein
MNVSVCWRFTAQGGVTFLSSEAEYVAISEAGKRNQVHVLHTARDWNQN